VEPCITLRPATLADLALFERWGVDPEVIAATTDDPKATRAFGDIAWPDELASQNEHAEYVVAELEGRPIGAMQICDPGREASHYWGVVDADLRAIDIWIGTAEDRGCGYGRRMMELAIVRCFASLEVRAIVIDPLLSNHRAHWFYQRMGFKPEGCRAFDGDTCLVHRLTREDWAASHAVR